MATPARFLLDQAESCARAAAAATLSNQRDTFLRSEAVWRTLAEREIATQTARAERERTHTEEPTDDR